MGDFLPEVLKIEAKNRSEYQLKIEENLQFWLENMQKARSVEELEVWRSKMEEASIVLARKDPVECQQLLNHCRDVYDERRKILPESGNIAKNAFWSGTEFGLAAWGLGGFLLAPVPGASVALGSLTLGYAGWEFTRSTKKFTDDVITEQSSEVQAESGIRFGSAVIGGALSVLGALELAGAIMFPPAAVLAVAAAATVPVVIDAYYRAEDYFDTKKRMKIAEEQGNQQLRQLEGVVSLEMGETSTRYYEPTVSIENLLLGPKVTSQKYMNSEESAFWNDIKLPTEKVSEEPAEEVRASVAL